MTEEEQKCKRDHDLLVAHLARFEEYREAMEERLGKLNELREQVMQDREAYLRNDVYSARHEDLRKRIEAVNDASLQRHESAQKDYGQRIDSTMKELEQRIEGNYSTLDERIGPLTAAQSKMMGIGAALVTVAALAGALLGHVWR